MCTARARRDFTVLFRPEADGAHDLLLLDSPAGTSSARFVPPFPAEDFWRGVTGGAEGLRDMRDPGSADAQRLAEGRRLGGLLFEALLTGGVAKAFQESLGSGDGLRLKLRFEAGAAALMRLPWEALFQREVNRYFGLSRLSPVVRFLEGRGGTEPLPLPRPLRVLVVAPSPTGVKGLALRQELRQIETALRLRHVELEVLEDARPTPLRDALQGARPFHVLHFMGHGGIGLREGEEEGYLLLEDEGRRARKLWASDLAHLLHDVESLRLVVLNACSTAEVPEKEEGRLFAGVATALVQAGVPAVVAMQTPIRDKSAIAFAGALYRWLAKGLPIEVAAVEGRFAVQEAEPESLAWAVPAVFLRIPDGRLFAGGARDPALDAPGLLRRYLERVVKQNRELFLPDLPGAWRPPAGLDDLFIEPRCHRPGGPSLLLSEAVLGGSRPVIQPGEAEVPFPSTLLLGEAGAGKTTALRWLALRLARERLERDAERSPLPGEAPVPVLLRAMACAEIPRQGTNQSLTDCLGAGTGLEAEDAPWLAEVLLDRIQEGDAVVLLDGLDEIADAAERSRLARDLDRLIEQAGPASGGGGRVIVTGRIGGSAAASLRSGTEILTLLPFGDEEIHAFLHRRASSGTPERFLESLPGSTRSLAGNPLLLSLLASLVESGEPATSLQRRIHLLAASVDALLDAGGRRLAARKAASRRDLLEMLALLAAEAQEGSGDIGWDRLRSVTARFAADGDSEPVVQALLIDAGLLVPAGGGRHAFSYSLFRQYFAGCWLAAEAARRPALLREKLEDPRWWEPLVLALGRLSEEWDEARLQGALGALLAGGDAFGGRLPRGSLCVAAALPEMHRVPEGLVEELCRRLLDALAAAGPETGLREPLEEAFLRLLAGEQRETVRRVLTLALAPVDGSGRLPAAAALLRLSGPPSAALTRAAAAVAGMDSAAWGWPVDGLLRDAAAADPPRLPEPPEALRWTLLHWPELARRVATHPSWLCLVAAVYGGLLPGHGFSAAAIHRDSPLTGQVREALENGTEPMDLIESFRALVLHSASPEEGADALIALTALGEPTADALRASDPAAHDAVVRLGSLVRRLEDCMPDLLAPALRSLRALAGQVPPEVWIDTVAAMLRTVLRFGGRPLDVLGLEDCAPPSVRPALLAEVLHLPFVGESPAYSLAVLLDVAGEPLSSPPLQLAEALAAASAASLAPLSRGRGWNLGPPRPRPAERAGVLAAALEALAALAEPFDFVRGWALARLAPLLAAEGMIAEALDMGLGLSDRLGTRQEAVAALLAAGGLTLADPRRPETLERRLSSRAALPPVVPAAAAPVLTMALPDLLPHASALAEHGAAPLLLAAALGDLAAQGFVLLSRQPEPAGDELSADRIPGLLEQLERGDDLARARAALALHGDRSDAAFRLSATAIGREGLVLLARRWRAAAERRPMVAQVARWALERVRHDDGEMLAQWAEQVAGGGEEARDAELLLAFLHDLHPRAWPSFLAAAAAERPLAVRRALFHSLCYLSVRRRLSAARWRELIPILQGWSFEEVATDGWIPDLPMALVEAASAGLGSATGAAGADAWLSGRWRPLAALFGDDSSSWPEAFRAAGSVRLASGLYRASLEAAAGRVEREPELLAVLLAWIAHRLENGLPDFSPYTPVTDDLLAVTALAAARRPEAFAGQAAGVPALPRWLRQAAEGRESFHGRRAAITLLAHLRTVSLESVAALRSALRDVAEVRDEALRSASLYRDAGPEACEELLSDLETGSPLTAYGAAHVLAALARSGGLRRGDSAEVVRRLTALLDGPRPELEVFTLTVERRRVRLVSLGCLKAGLYALMAALAGPASAPGGEGT